MKDVTYQLITENDYIISLGSTQFDEGYAVEDFLSEHSSFSLLFDDLGRPALGTSIGDAENPKAMQILTPGDEIPTTSDIFVGPRPPRWPW